MPSFFSDTTHPSTDIDSPIGLLAGWGRFPIRVAEALKRTGRQVHCLGIKDHADHAALARLCDDYREVGVARLGSQMRYFRRRGVRLATMAGKIQKTILFHRFYWLKHLPDWQCVRAFYPHFITRTKDRRDDTMLLAVVDAFARAGIRFAPATDFAPELLVKFGQLSGPPLTKAQQQDVEFGWRLAKEMGRLDVGQTVTVKGRAVLAVEAVEGTDACIGRTGELCPAGGFTMVKVAKPQQDMRFDVPTVGLGTVEQLARAGGRVLAIEAGSTIVLDENEVVAFAHRHKIAIVAIRDGQL